MVKSIIYTTVALLACIILFVTVDIYLERQFDEFHGALETLYAKVEDNDANREDGYAIKEMWADKKSKLHVFIPHNDISYVDYWLNEACGLIYKKEYDLALGKLEVLLEISQNLPDAYTLKLENIF
ncbi:MAG: DUF4363 family protein [Clostridia bacterium]|nr:DUF4363 family protein [Clostridia bacterium]